MTIQDIQAEIVDEFSMFDDWEERYQYMIDLGKDLPLIESEYKTDEFIIKGCQSKVWVHAGLVDNKVVFTADSDAIITKGIIALLINVYNGEKPETIVKENLYFINQIGLQEHLSPTRANGLLEMVKRMKIEALKYV